MIKEYLSSRKKTMTSPFDSSSKKKKIHQVDRFIPHSVSKNLYSLFNDVPNSQGLFGESSTSSNTKNYTHFLEQNLIND